MIAIICRLVRERGRGVHLWMNGRAGAFWTMILNNFMYNLFNSTNLQVIATFQLFQCFILAWNQMTNAITKQNLSGNRKTVSKFRKFPSVHIMSYSVVRLLQHPVYFQISDHYSKQGLVTWHWVVKRVHICTRCRIHCGLRSHHRLLSVSHGCRP
jgi:hypothetical protein